MIKGDKQSCRTIRHYSLIDLGYSKKKCFVILSLFRVALTYLLARQNVAQTAKNAFYRCTSFTMVVGSIVPCKNVQRKIHISSVSCAEAVHMTALSSWKCYNGVKQTVVQVLTTDNVFKTPSHLGWQAVASS